MKYTKAELQMLADREDVTHVETYKYMFGNEKIHTDTIKYIGTGDFDNSEIENLPYDKCGEVDVDVVIMDAEDYNTTIYANCGERFEDEHEEGDKVLVIVVKL